MNAYQIFIQPSQQAFDTAGNVLSGATLTFSLSGSSTPTNAYSDAALAVPLTNPLSADSAGVWVPIYLDPAVSYRVVLKTQAGAVLKTWDPANESASTLASFLFPQSNTELVNGITPVNLLYYYGHVLRYAANGNTIPGTTDMTTAFQNAALSSLQPYAPTDTYKITGPIPLRANQKWQLNGSTLSIASSTLEVFTATTVDDWSIDGLNIVGDGTTIGTAKGVKVTDCRRWRINKPTLRNIRGWGIYSQPGSSTTERGSHGTIDNPQINSCYVGYEDVDGTGAEYCTILDPRITFCTTVGLKTAAGNVRVIGGHIVDNVAKGAHVTAGGGNNSNHGGFNGTHFNHNGTFGLHCEAVINGESFTGCHFYQSAVWLDRCKGIVITGGLIDAPVYNYKDGSSGINIIRGMYCPGTAFVRNGGTNNGHDQLIIEQCFGPGALTDVSGGVDVATGVNTNDAFRVHVYARRAATANQSLTSGVAATLLFPTEVNDRRLAYDPATGIFTVPANMASWYRIKASMLFTGTAMSATASIVDLKVNGTSTRVNLPKINSTTRLQIDIDEVIYLAAADAVTLVGTITGTTPVFGDATYESHLSIERLG